MRRRLLALLAAFTLSAPTAHAVQIFDFVGFCTLGCTDYATAELSLSDSFVPGNLLVTGDLLSLGYHSSNLSFFVEAPNLFVVAGGPLFPSGNLGGELYLIGLSGLYTTKFELAADGGTWFAESSSGRDDAGIDGVLSRERPLCGVLFSARDAVCPEPATFALMSIGLAGLGFSRRRKLPATSHDRSFRFVADS